MKVYRISKKVGRSKTLGNDCGLDIGWASGPGFRHGPENYFSIKAEADDHDFSFELDVAESRRVKEQLEKFLQHIDNGKQFWEPGNYFQKMKKK